MEQSREKFQKFPCNKNVKITQVFIFPKYGKFHQA